MTTAKTSSAHKFGQFVGQSTQTVTAGIAKAGKFTGTVLREVTAAPFQLTGFVTGFTGTAFMEGYRVGQKQARKAMLAPVAE
jgi:hypothetical protein